MNYEKKLSMLLEAAAKKEKELASKKIPHKQEVQKDTNESKKPLAKKVSKKQKPDFLDIDKDGNTKEPMKSAIKSSKKSKIKPSKKNKKETAESIQPLGELNLKPWKNKSAFSKSGYEKVAKRQELKMKDADKKADYADETDDYEEIKKAGQEWKKAKSLKDKAEKKSSMAKESTAKETVKESSDLTNMLKLAGLRPLNG